MEVVGSAAAILQLTQASVKAIQFCIDYVQKCKNAKKNVKELARDLTALQRIFSEVKDVIDNRPDDLGSLQHLAPLIRETRTEVLQILAQLPQEELGRRAQIMWPLSEDKTTEFVKSFSQKLAFINACISLEDFKVSEQTLTIVNDLRKTIGTLSSSFDQIAEDKKRSQIFEWISFNRFRSLNFKERHQDRQSIRHRKAGDHTLHDDLYRQWKSRPFYGGESWLWAIGEAGSRKSMTMSVLIDDLINAHLDENTEIAILYCQYEFTDLVVEQTLIHILGNLTAQLLRRQKYLPYPLTSAFEEHSKQGDPSLELMFEIFLSAVRSHGAVYLIVDGLDELNSSVGLGLLEKFGRLHQERVKFLISSRPHLFAIKGRANSTNTMAISPTRDEIAAYLEDAIASNQRLQIKIRGDQDFAKRLVNEISSRAGQSFTFAVAMLGTVQAGTTKAEMLRLLESSKTLNDVFGATMKRIRQRPEPEKDSAITTLSWLAYARTSLTLDRLLMAYAVCIDTGSEEDSIPETDIILDLCEGLIQVQPSSNTVMLTHLTVREFLVAQPELEQVKTESKLAQACIRHLMSPVFANLCTTADELDARQTENCFTTYAASYWSFHARAAHETDLVDLIIEFAEQPFASSALQLLPIEISNSFAGILAPQMYRLSLCQDLVPPSYLLAQFKLSKSQEELRQRHPDIVGASVPWGSRYSPLHLAVWLEDEDTAKVLLREGVNLDHQAQYGITPLHLAASYSMRGSKTCKILEWMLKSLDDPDIRDLRDRDRSTALHSASIAGIGTAIKLFLEKGYDPNATDDDDNTPLHLFIGSAGALTSSVRGMVIKTMIEHGADPTIQNRQKRSCLSLVVDKDWPEQVAQFREAINPTTRQRYGFSDEDIEQSDILYQAETRAASRLESRTPYQATQTVEQLASAMKKQLRTNLREPTAAHLENNVKPMPFNALMYAARKGGCDTITLLLAGEGDVNAVDARGRTALHFAAEMGREATIWTLLSAGADPDVEDWKGLKPIDLLPDSANRLAEIASALVQVGSIRREADYKFASIQDRQRWISAQLHEIVERDAYLKEGWYEVVTDDKKMDPMERIRREFRR